MKITFLGAGSTVFVKNVLGDCILTPELGHFDVALFDIDPLRLDDSYQMLTNLNKKYNGKANIKAYTDRLEALRGADFVVNAIQVGGYGPCTVTDFEVPKKYGLRQTIADTLGIGGIFRALRTIPVLESFNDDIKKVCPNALFLNYTNPMCMLSGYMQKKLGMKAIGLCHSVQACVEELFSDCDMLDMLGKVRYNIAGINHQAWLLNICDESGVDLYPEIKARAMDPKYFENRKYDLVRLEIMKRFGYYVTESSVHTAEYTPYFIKKNYPELIDDFNIALDEYPRRCIHQIEEWKKMRTKVTSSEFEHTLSREFAAPIIKAHMTGEPFRVHANVLNKNLITNLPYDACVEVACFVDKNGVNPCYVGNIPEQCAALNRTNINVQNMVIEAAEKRSKELVYMAAYLDPHTASELSLDDIKNMCDDMFAAHKDWLPKYN